MMLSLPVGRIQHEYSMVSEGKRRAISNILRSDAYYVMTMRNKTKEALLDMKAYPPVVMHFILNAIEVSRKEYGNIWLEELQNKLSQMA